MRKIFVIAALLCFTLCIKPAYGQRLKVFIDCSNAFCDMDYIRTEINIVDFLLDRQVADVHVLITSQSTGGGGDQYQLIFFGQNQFKQLTDTLRFNVHATATPFEVREVLLKYLKLGLIPFIAKTGSIKDLVIDMKKKADEKKEEGKTVSPATRDPWNYWVFRVGVNGDMDADAVYENARFTGQLSASRVTDDIKFAFEVNAGKSTNSYQIDDTSGTKIKIVNKNDDYNINQYLIKSINSHWSYGYELAYARSTFSNNQHQLKFTTGIEYDIFPYKEVNTKFFTLSYTIDVRRNAYFDTTLYDKKNETLAGQGFNAKLRLHQKWGNISFGAEYHNYLHNWKYLNLGLNTQVELRITGGLSFNIFASGDLIRDQLFLPKQGATPEEVLTKRRQLATGYRFFGFFGLSYRFGSKLNNFVNPRFD